MTTGATSTRELLLSVDHVRVAYAGVVALDDVSFDLQGNELLGVIGPNGAGKTTLFNTISRFVEPAGGAIRLDGTDLLGLRAPQVAARGVSRTFQNIALYDAMPVIDNVLLGGFWYTDHTLWRTVLRGSSWRRANRELLDETHQAMEELGVAHLADRLPSDLPLGTRKRVELARALVGRPRVLCLDEPANGLNAREVGALGDTVSSLVSERGISVMLVEHNMDMIMRICHRLVVLNFGRVISQGTCDEVRDDPDVRHAYLGAAL